LGCGEDWLLRALAERTIKVIAVDGDATWSRKALDGAGLQQFPPERKKDPTVLFSIACRILWNSSAQ